MNYNDFHKLSGFNRERIPERVTHAKGAGAFGFFEVTQNIQKYSEANLFSELGKRTQVFVRFSNYRGEKGTPDTIRDPRGMAIKFYTEDGNWDLTGNSIPVFFISDPKFLPEFAHSQKRNPKTNLFDPTMEWNFFISHPESLHAVLLNYSERGIPRSYRNMHSFSCNAYRFYQSENHYFVKFHLITNQGIDNLNSEEAMEIASKNPDFYAEDLYQSIENKDYPSWTLYAQIIGVNEIHSLPFDPFDCTKVWPHSIAPLVEIGKITLNQNVNRYFTEVEQAAFSPSNLVRGIGVSPDPLLQARLLAYPDAARYRLGVNYEEIPVNKPICPFHRDTQDGKMRISENFSTTNHDSYHSENFINRYTDSFSFSFSRKYEFDPYTQPKEFWKILSEPQKVNLVSNLTESLKKVPEEIFQKALVHFSKIDLDLKERILQKSKSRLNSIY
jgi:catalase